MQTYLIAKAVEGRFEKVGFAHRIASGDVSLPLPEGEEREAVESAIRFAAADKAVNFVDTIHGYRVSRA